MKRLYLNTVLSLIYQIVAIINGLLVPRLILSKFGADAYGLTTSITQMVSVISFLDLGVGSVVQVAFYKPLARNDTKRISEVYAASVKYFGTIARILLGYIVFLCFYYSYGKQTGFSSIYNITLILAISISTIAQYFFGINNTLLLNADQKIYIVTTLNIISTFVNAIVVLVCIKLSLSIQLVKLASSIVFLLKPLCMSIYVKKHYKIERIKLTRQDVLKNKWSGMIQHLTTALTNNIAYYILTFLADLKMIAIYTVYVLPLNCIRQLVESLTTSYKSYFGNLLVTNEKLILKIEFRKFEIIFHFFIVTIFSTLAKVLIPFVILYTDGASDANYVNVEFCICILFAYAFYCLRIPYTTIIFSAGHFKETQIYCIIEIVINLILSIGLFFKYEIVGIAIGIMISSAYRMLVSVLYLKDNILLREFGVFIRQIFADILSIVFTIIFTNNFIIRDSNLLNYIMSCILPFVVSVVTTIFVYMILFYNEAKEVISSILKKLF